MGPLIKTRNVGEREDFFRSAIGVILIGLAFLTQGVFGWVLGLFGVLIVFTAIFGY